MPNQWPDVVIRPNSTGLVAMPILPCSVRDTTITIDPRWIPKRGVWSDFFALSERIDPKEIVGEDPSPVAMCDVPLLLEGTRRRSSLEDPGTATRTGLGEGTAEDSFYHSCHNTTNYINDLQISSPTEKTTTRMTTTTTTPRCCSKSYFMVTMWVPPFVCTVPNAPS